MSREQSHTSPCLAPHSSSHVVANLLESRNSHPQHPFNYNPVAKKIWPACQMWHLDYSTWAGFEAWISTWLRAMSSLYQSVKPVDICGSKVLKTTFEYIADLRMAKFLHVVHRSRHLVAVREYSHLRSVLILNKSIGHLQRGTYVVGHPQHTIWSSGEIIPMNLRPRNTQYLSQ
jgi:hypothetical protein